MHAAEAIGHAGRDGMPEPRVLERPACAVVSNTGFKGYWLSLWLLGLGAKVAGLSLPPPAEPLLFTLAGLSDRCPPCSLPSATSMRYATP